MSKKKKNKKQNNKDIALKKEELAKKKRNKGILIGLIVLLVICVAAYFNYQQNKEEEIVEIEEEVVETEEGNVEDDAASDNETTTVEEDTSLITEPLMEFDNSATYLAYLEIEDYGTITIELEPEYAPITVSNFITLANEGFYDGLTFHRIIEDFMMQGGDPNGNGTGGSSRNIKGEFSENGVDNTLSHTRGAVSMARSNDSDSGSSQFFICQEDCDWLNGSYAVFGYVTEGMEIVDTICESAEPTDSNGTIDAEDQPVIKSLKIIVE